MNEATLYATTGNPVPERHVVGTFSGHGQKKIRYAIFKCERPAARGTIVLLQGRNESIEKYFETINDLTSRGFWVATFDLRGQGGSERLLKKGDAGHVRRFSDYQKDVSLFLEHIVLPDTRLPFFLLAHSTGALVALSMAGQLTSRIERMVLCSAFVALGGQSISAPWIRRLAASLTWLGLGRLRLGRDQRERHFEGNPLTSDEGRFQRNLALMSERPELFLGAPTARWLHEVLKTMPRAVQQNHLTNITIPTLLLAGMRDALTPYATQERLSRNFRAAQLIPITGARHELFHERDVFRAQALAAIDAFFAPEE